MSGENDMFRKSFLWHLLYVRSISYYGQLSRKIKNPLRYHLVAIGPLVGKTKQNRKTHFTITIYVDWTLTTAFYDTL